MHMKFILIIHIEIRIKDTTFIHLEGEGVVTRTSIA